MHLKRRFPPVLTNKILFALSCVRELDPEQVTQLLKRFRRNRMRYIATVGIGEPKNKL